MPFPYEIGQPKETREWYDAAAQKAVMIASLRGERIVVKMTRHGRIVADLPDRIDVHGHILTITHKTDPDLLADEMEWCAVTLGFDTGMRKGRKSPCRT